MNIKARPRLMSADGRRTEGTAQQIQIQIRIQVQIHIKIQIHVQIEIQIQIHVQGR